MAFSKILDALGICPRRAAKAPFYIYSHFDILHNEVVKDFLNHSRPAFFLC